MTTATAAEILGLERKAFDNLIGRLQLDEIPRGRQGIARRIPVSLLPDLYLTAELSSRLGVPVREALTLVRSLSAGQQPLAPFVRMALDLPSLRDAIDAQLTSAVESVVRRPRGRPRRPAA